ncbi:hypothetical protein HBA54_26280 [Pelagibius litoralis]|uniref:Uncharacterized protein n=1 Tax=Pelagibius litoralis TaxID=374515 RepID=A0A967KEU8_9PROT|nr:hypothetical protein [Pelagibius litoralis]
MTQRPSSNRRVAPPTNEPNAWAKFTTVELSTKLRELQELIDNGILTERSAEYQLTEIAIIENELARRHDG